MLLHSYLYLNDWLHYPKGIIARVHNIHVFLRKRSYPKHASKILQFNFSETYLLFTENRDTFFKILQYSWLSQLLKIKFVAKILNDNDVNSTKSWMPSRRILERTNYERNFVWHHLTSIYYVTINNCRKWCLCFKQFSINKARRRTSGI